MARFEPARDMKINGTPSADGVGFLLRTDGLSQRGVPELEMTHVPEEHAKNAAAVLNSIADYVANHSRVEDGQRVAVTSPHGALIARLAPGPALPPQGIWGKMFKNGRRVQRVIEAVDAIEYPKVLLSTMMLWRARALMLDGQNEAARAELLRSIGWFAGDPEKRADLFMGFPYNWENHLAYAALAEISPTEERFGWLAKAFERSEEFERFVVGDSADELRVLDASEVADRVLEITAENADPAKQLPVASGVTMIASPLRTRVELETEMVADRRMTIVPTLCVQYQSAGTIDSSELCQLITDVIAAHSADAARLAIMTAEIRDIYEGGNDEAPSLGQPRAYRAGDRMVSLLLADVARRSFAGLTLPELRATYGVSSDDTMRKQAEFKMVNLTAREGDAYASIVGGQA